MANYGQYHQKPTAAGGGWQAVVELCGLAATGLTFWSRRRFAIGTELVIRVRRDLLPPEARLLCDDEEGPWASLHGYVVDCRHERREDGSQAYRVALLLEAAGPIPEPLPRMDSRLPGLMKPGLN